MARFLEDIILRVRCARYPASYWVERGLDDRWRWKLRDRWRRVIVADDEDYATAIEATTAAETFRSRVSAVWMTRDISIEVVE